MKAVLKWVKVFGVIFIAILIGGVPVVKTVARIIDEQPSRPLLQNEAGAWVLELSWWGGFTGQAINNGTITSQGKVQSNLWPTPAPPGKGGCQTLLSEADLVALKKALATAVPTQWKASYTPESDDGCCDRFYYGLTLHRREADGTVQQSTTAWYDANEGLFPPDLAAVEQASMAILRKTDIVCKQMEVVRHSLQQIASGKGDLSLLSVTYDDRHALHGGLSLTIHGSGLVEQTVVRQESGTPRRVSHKELLQLVKRLIAQKAWEQRTPDRPALPDESRATMTIGYGDTTVHIWEWFNDMKQNRRIGDIVAFMKQIAWKPPRP